MLQCALKQYKDLPVRKFQLVRNIMLTPTTPSLLGSYSHFRYTHTKTRQRKNNKQQFVKVAKIIKPFDPLNQNNSTVDHVNDPVNDPVTTKTSTSTTSTSTSIAEKDKEIRGVSYVLPYTLMSGSIGSLISIAAENPIFVATSIPIGICAGMIKDKNIMTAAKTNTWASAGVKIVMIYVLGIPVLCCICALGIWISVKM